MVENTNILDNSTEVYQLFFLKSGGDNNSDTLISFHAPHISSASSLQMAKSVILCMLLMKGRLNQNMMTKQKDITLIGPVSFSGHAAAGKTTS